MCEFRSSSPPVVPGVCEGRQNSQSVSHKVVGDGQQLGVSDAGAGADRGVRQVAAVAAERGGADGRPAAASCHHLRL